MPRRPKDPTKKPRTRDPYARALAAAQKRIERARIELQRCLVKAEGLKQEIPRLEQIIATLSPDNVFLKAPSDYISGQMKVVSLDIENPRPLAPAFFNSEALAKVPLHLRRFTMPDTSTAGSIPAGATGHAVPAEDELLPDVPGEEILP